MQAFEFHKYLYIGQLFVGALHGDYKPGWKFEGRCVQPSYVFKLQIGKGAGYIGGCTLFFGRYSGSAKWWKMNRGYQHRPTPFGWEIGWTRNGNTVPYVSH